ncbi:uncharacterized protein LOC116213229 isoform X1 [Punica granatum]|uniref:Uncharacterized protein LOC116213229 isoform X1 n=1 Tax=Punica granatum TaxID=22663 RepID=A0A6P8E227_PUNGR|nr:uncharacterized protein LOC116213229 isoform X1 [Punica granatum]
MNKAMLSKTIWALISKNDSLTMRAMVAKYGKFPYSIKQISCDSFICVEGKTMVSRNFRSSRFVDLSWSTWEFKPSTSTLQIFTLRSFPPLTYLRPHHMSRNSASHLLFIAVTTPPLPSLVFMTKHGGKFTQMQLGETLRQQPLLV